MAIAVPEFQRLLTGLTVDLGGKLDRLAGAVGGLEQRDALRFITDAYPEIATPYLAAASNATTVWYDEQPTDGPTAFRAEPAELPAREDLGASGRWAMLQKSPASALKGSATRAVFDSSRRTVQGNAHREGVRWARHASSSACGFCRMLATRGAVYKSQRLALRAHDHCHCIAVPDRDGLYKPAAYVEQWQHDYEKVRDLGASSPAAIAKGMDRIGRDRLQAAAAQAVERKAAADTAVWLDAEFEHKAAVEYWRRVDAEDLHSIPPSEAAEVPPAPPVVETPMDRAVREFEEAVATGDDDLIDAAAGRMESLEAAEEKAAAKAARAEARKSAKREAQSTEIVRLIDEEGWNPAEAEAHMTGKSVEFIRRRDFIAQQRAQGISGKGFDDILTTTHKRMVEELYIQAEDATRGAMINRRYALKVNPKNLWSVNESTARKWMSEEMAGWFDANGRITRGMLREMILAGDDSMARFASRTRDFLR